MSLDIKGLRHELAWATNGTMVCAVWISTSLHAFVDTILQMRWPQDANADGHGPRLGSSGV